MSCSDAISKILLLDLVYFKFEFNNLEQSRWKLHEPAWKYTDGIFYVWPCGTDELNISSNDANNKEDTH